MILNFRDFLNEKFIPQPDDTVTSASDKNFFNDEDMLISKFNSYKTDIENIYKTYSDQKDLMNKLFNKGFIEQKTADPKKKKFKNKYLSKWAEICDKKRKISELEEIINGNKDDLQNYNQSISDNKGNQSVIDYTQEKIENASDRIQKNSEKVEELEKDIFDLDRMIKKDFELMRKKHIDSKKRIIKDESSKKSNPANIPEEKEK